ncbi:hypothetical protein [Nocardia sp. NPDC050435]|uniref:hypothetical protein n=1 Tax=Nocardia sp. NPDC050435 TaxID=3155040 RepID=UPI003409BF03
MRADDYTEPATAEERQSRARQHNLLCGGLIAVGALFAQGMLTAGPLSSAGTISVLAFAVALPLLAVLLLIGEGSGAAAKGVAVLASSIGVIAAFWQIAWIAGIVALVTGGIATGIYGAHFTDSRVGRLTRRFRRGTGDTPASAHQPPPVRHPYPTGPEAPTAFMPHPARQGQQFPAEQRFPNQQFPGGPDQQYPRPGAEQPYPSEPTEQITHDQTKRYSNGAGAPQHPGAQQYPGPER